MCFSLGQGAAQIQELYKKGAESFLLFPAFMASASEPKNNFELQILVWYVEIETFDWKMNDAVCDSY